MTTPRTPGQPSDKPPSGSPKRQDASGDAAEMRLLDGLLGQLPASEGEALSRTVEQDPDLARRQADIASLLAAESLAFAAEADPDWDPAHAATRVTAWVRAEAQGEARRRKAAERQRSSVAGRGWARVFAWSIGLHVVLLGVFAYVLREESHAQKEPRARIAMFEDQGYPEDDTDPLESEFARAYPNLKWRDVARINDELVLREQETFTDELPGAFEEAAALAGRGAGLAERRGMFDQPIGVVATTIRRTDLALKRRRLDLLGFNADGTLRAVERGLAYLAPRQNKNGSWPSAGSRGDIEQTAITLLAFLGDGNASHTRSSRSNGSGGSNGSGSAARAQGEVSSDHGKVVAKGVHWLRDRLFNASTSDAERAAHLAAYDVAVLGPATVALCEDYMLSYGWLSPEASERRAREIAELAGRLQADAASGSTAASAAPSVTADPVEQPWAIWGLDAAARVGVVASTDGALRAFRRWVETASNATPTLSAMSFLSVGTALLYKERGARKPRFLLWSKANAKQLVDKLGPRGYVRSEDPIGDTALIVLGLQVAYRTY